MLQRLNDLKWQQYLSITDVAKIKWLNMLKVLLRIAKHMYPTYKCVSNRSKKLTLGFSVNACLLLVFLLVICKLLMATKVAVGKEKFTQENLIEKMLFIDIYFLACWEKNHNYSILCLGTPWPSSQNSFRVNWLVQRIWCVITQNHSSAAHLPGAVQPPVPQCPRHLDQGSGGPVRRGQVRWLAHEPSSVMNVHEETQAAWTLLNHCQLLLPGLQRPPKKLSGINIFNKHTPQSNSQSARTGQFPRIRIGKLV